MTSEVVSSSKLSTNVEEVIVSLIVFFYKSTIQKDKTTSRI